MYDGDYNLTYDDEANEIIGKYIHSQMVRALDHAVGNESIIRKFRNDNALLSEERRFLIDKTRHYFPEYFEPEKIPDTLRELYSIIYSEDRYIPDLVEEYVLAAAINKLSEDMAMDISDNEDIETMPDREKIIKALAQRYEEDCDRKPGEAYDDAANEISEIENLSGIVETVFYDSDFEFLNITQPEALVNSGLDREYGIGAIEPARKRLPDGSLEYLGEIDRQESIIISV